MVNVHSRAIRSKFGEYDGMYNNPTPNRLGSAVTTWHFWYFALSRTGVRGRNGTSVVVFAGRSGPCPGTPVGIWDNRSVAALPPWSSRLPTLPYFITEVFHAPTGHAVVRARSISMSSSYAPLPTCQTTPRTFAQDSASASLTKPSTSGHRPSPSGPSSPRPRVKSKSCVAAVARALVLRVGLGLRVYPESGECREVCVAVDLCPSPDQRMGVRRTRCTPRT